MKEYYYIPINLNLKEMLISRGHCRKVLPKQLDRFYYLIDHIYLTTTICAIDEKEYIPINHGYLVNILTTKWAGRVKNVLNELGIIEEEPGKCGKANYLRGVRSKAFRIAPVYAEAAFKRIPVSHTPLADRIQRQQLKRNLDTVSGHPGRALIQKSVENLEFDSEAACLAVQDMNFETEHLAEEEEVTSADGTSAAYVFLGDASNSTLVPGQKYYFQVSAVDTSDNLSACASQSASIVLSYAGDFYRAGASSDGYVNLLDYGVLKTNWKKSLCGKSNGDANYDCLVNALDYGYVKADYKKPDVIP